MHDRLKILLVTGTFLSPSAFAPASATDVEANTAMPGIEFELGIAGDLAPAYEGASSYILTPAPLFKLYRLTLPNGFQIGGKNGNGFSIGPAFNVVGSREASDHDELDGLKDIDTAFEAGLRLRYQTDMFRAYTEIRQGFGGHEGIVGEAGFDLIARPDPQFTLYAGPRIFFADDHYTKTYFGVSPSEAAASDFTAYHPDGGIKSYGFEAGGRFDVNEYWAFRGRLTYQQFTGDAADSPIVQSGSDHQFTARFGVVRKFQFDF